MIRHFQIVAALFLLLLLTACSDGSYILTGELRAPVDESDVIIYLEDHADYETIGWVEAVSDIGFSRQKAQDKVVKQLKKQAAKMGANGVILSAVYSENEHEDGIYVDGIYFSSSNKKMKAQGKAVFVFER